MSKYDEIIDMPHHVSTRRPQMDRLSRAAQFSPFDALKGYDEELAESDRSVFDAPEFSEDFIRELDGKLKILATDSATRPKAKFVIYQKDETKNGGNYVNIEKNVKAVDTASDEIRFTDGTAVKISSIINIESELFG